MSMLIDVSSPKGFLSLNLSDALLIFSPHFITLATAHFRSGDMVLNGHSLNGASCSQAVAARDLKPAPSEMILNVVSCPGTFVWQLDACIIKLAFTFSTLLKLPCKFIQCVWDTHLLFNAEYCFRTIFTLSRHLKCPIMYKITKLLRTHSCSFIYLFITITGRSTHQYSSVRDFPSILLLC